MLSPLPSPTGKTLAQGNNSCPPWALPHPPVRSGQEPPPWVALPGCLQPWCLDSCLLQARPSPHQRAKGLRAQGLTLHPSNPSSVSPCLAKSRQSGSLCRRFKMLSPTAERSLRARLPRQGDAEGLSLSHCHRLVLLSLPLPF